MRYVAGENPRRTQLIGKRAISGLKLVNALKEKNLAIMIHYSSFYILFAFLSDGRARN
jgi:hypothetical protein